MLSQEQQQVLLQTQQKDQLAKRLERYHYYGILSEYQLHPPSLVNSLSYNKLNPYQHFLFKRVLHGLKVYKPEEVNKLHWDKRRRITRVWKRGQREINAWKQTISNKIINDYLSRTFKHSPFVKGMVDIPADDILEDYNNTLTFKDLGIKYEDVILKFMSLGLLPKNYLTLKTK